jgi:hypothetical protein
MDDWAFISMAKTKADAPNFKRKVVREDALNKAQEGALDKAQTALALDYGVALENSKVRGALALAAAVVLNAAFFGAVQERATDARTPSGEVIVAEIEADTLPAYAQATGEPRAAVAF